MTRQRVWDGSLAEEEKQCWCASWRPQVDVLGYYAALGLDGRRARQVSADDIKSAFRRAAQTMHPDKFSMAEEEERVEAEEAFRKVRRRGGREGSRSSGRGGGASERRPSAI